MKLEGQLKFANKDRDSELRELLRLSIDGDTQAYNTFLKRVAEMLTSYLTKKMSARSSKLGVEDLVQDVLLAVHQKKHTYRSDLPILPWLFSIAKYRLIDSYRQASKHELVTFDDDLNSFNDFAISASEARLDVSTLFESLPPKQREVLRLAKIEELPLEEISRRVDMSVPAVKVSIHRSIQLLRKTYFVVLDENEN